MLKVNEVKNVLQNNLMLFIHRFEEFYKTENKMTSVELVIFVPEKNEVEISIEYWKRAIFYNPT